MPELITRASWGQPRSPEEGPREGLERARTGNPGQGCGPDNLSGKSSARKDDAGPDRPRRCLLFRFRLTPAGPVGIARSR